MQPYGTLNVVDAGDAIPLRFNADGYRRLDVLKDSGSPFSRRVDCATLRVPSQDPAFITPRELPIDTVTAGNSKLTVNASGVFTYPWKTLEEWAGTCREVVVTRDEASSTVPSSASCRSNHEDRNERGRPKGRSLHFSC
jgi:extracellular elastinolytic metalloproteinase